LRGRLRRLAFPERFGSAAEHDSLNADSEFKAECERGTAPSPLFRHLSVRMPTLLHCEGREFALPQHIHRRCKHVAVRPRCLFVSRSSLVRKTVNGRENTCQATAFVKLASGLLPLIAIGAVRELVPQNPIACEPSPPLENSDPDEKDYVKTTYS
jgi:hypothetical protein